MFDEADLNHLLVAVQHFIETTLVFDSVDGDIETYSALERKILSLLDGDDNEKESP